MKKMLYIAAIMLLTLGMASCDKDDDTSNNGNNTENPSGGTNPGTDPGADPGTTIPDGYVDLGLPHGTLWATCNIGATTPEGIGNYYAWGEISVKDDYSWSTYVWGTSSSNMTKYNETDQQKTLASADDAATQVLGNGARIPTSEDWDELISNTTSEVVVQNGVYGRKFTSNHNSNSIFLPAAGYRVNTIDTNDFSNAGFYWSSMVNTDRFYSAMNLRFTRQGTPDISYHDRYYGQPVRAVISR